MPRKKKFFNKSNSVKYLLLPGNPNATNADGKVLPNVFVPVPKQYKAGTSLLFSNIESLTALPDQNDENKEPDLEKIVNSLDDDYDSDDQDYKAFISRMKNVDFSSKNSKITLVEEYEEDNESNCSYASGQFSDIDLSDEEAMFNDVYPKTSILTSAKDDCPESIKTLNEQFERMNCEYDDDQIGALDGEEICGHLTTESERIQDLLNSCSKKEEEIEIGNYDASIKEQILKYVENAEEENFEEIVTEEPPDYDCESILSTYSNKYNHPTVIREETAKIRKIKPIPEKPFRRKLTKSQLRQLNNSNDHDTTESEDSDDHSLATTYNIRSKNETPEEKKQRKSLCKEIRRERRMIKKENKIAFKNEKKNQIAETLNSQRNHGIRLL